MTRNSERESEKINEQFKTDLLIHNPPLYQAMFESDTPYVDEDQIEHVQPENEEEFKDLLKELKQFGVIH
jgi:hypothetical protein